MFRWNGCHKYFNGMFVGHILGHKPKQERELNIKREHTEAETSIRLNSAMLKLRLHYPLFNFTSIAIKSFQISILEPPLSSIGIYYCTSTEFHVIIIEKNVESTNNGHDNFNLC